MTPKRFLSIFGKCLLALTLSIIGLVIICRLFFREQIVSYIDKLECEEYIERLSDGGEYKKDRVSFAYTFDVPEEQSEKIRTFFKLDSIICGTTDTWQKTLKIARLAGEIPHEQPAYEHQPKERNAIYLWNWSKEHNSGFNCRLHAIMLHEMLLSEGIINRVVTCLPADSTDTDCHVVNNVWIPEFDKWMMIDSDGREYPEDEHGNVLSLAEMRERMIGGLPIIFHQLYDKVIDQQLWISYWAKNLFHFCTIENTTYDVESAHENKYIDLVPQSHPNIKTMDGCNVVYTSDDKRFWRK